MAYRETRIYSGAMLEIERVKIGENGKVLHRASRSKRTSNAQQELNRKRAQVRLMRIMNCNFTKGDFHITLTFAHGVNDVERRKAWARFIRKLRALCKKRTGQELKYICVLETEAVRPHYHLVCSAFALDVAKELQALWDMGLVGWEPLDGCPDYGWLARYLTKQSEKIENAKRWYSSRNLEEPTVQEKRIKRRALARQPAVPKEYYVMNAYHEVNINGWECEYIIAMRYDRRQDLAAAMVQQMERSDTWEIWKGAGR